MVGVPELISRTGALVFTPLYLLFLASALGQAAKLETPLLIGCVAVGAAVLITIITILSYRFSQATGRQSRYTINTLMWLTIGCSIYLAYISQFLTDLHSKETTWTDVAEFLFYCGFFVVVTTIVLVRFTDALLAILIWLAKAVVRFNRRPINK